MSSCNIIGKYVFTLKEREKRLLYAVVDRSLFICLLPMKSNCNGYSAIYSGHMPVDIEYMCDSNKSEDVSRPVHHALC